MENFKELLLHSGEIESSLGYTFKDKELLALAFVHRSFVNENSDSLGLHNERLEFLGDSILGFLIAEYLYIKLPKATEGELSNLRSHLVNATSCIHYMKSLQLESYLLLSKGEQQNPGKGRESILADLFEAIIGAIHLDGGIESTRDFLLIHFEDNIKKAIKDPWRNWKADLQNFIQKKIQETPFYEILNETGPDHHKVFTIAVCTKEGILGEGSGESKKEAQQEAAKDAMQKLGIIDS